MFNRRQTHRENSLEPVGWMTAWREIKTLKSIDKSVGAASHQAVAKVEANVASNKAGGRLTSADHRICHRPTLSGGSLK